MSIFLKSIGFKSTLEAQHKLSYKLSDMKNDSHFNGALFTSKHDGDVFLPGTPQSQFSEILIEETQNPDRYDVSFTNGSDDIVAFRNADIQDIKILMQSLINECYFYQGYEAPYNFTNLYPDIAVYSPFHGIDGRDDDFTISHEEDGIRILKNPSETYPNYDIAKNELDSQLKENFSLTKGKLTNSSYSL